MANELMAEFFKNGIVQSIAATLIVALLVWGYKKVHFWWDERKILDFIKSSQHTFRSTEAIAASINLESSRIQHVAAKSKNLRRNSKEKESWCLAE
ncbi:hypothetical protein [Shewanella indica]|uniref:hypothetical protein n=1 Tax=Shewanella indica TaxID=768528 RepID=UPI001CFD0CA4|nr:hypothetical protein [Shewanella indica]